MSVLALLLGALVLLAALAALPLSTTRALGAAGVAVLVYVVTRHAWGDVAAILLAAALAIAASRLLPPRLLRRIAFLVPSVVLLVAVTTALMYLAPGSPFAQERALAPSVEAALRERYGVPKSAFAFFNVYTRRLVVAGDLGPALKVQGRTVAELLAPAVPVSLALGGSALLLASGLGIGLGVAAGLRPNAAVDHLSMGLALLGLSLPNFVIGAGLVIVFALRLGWLPVAGWADFASVVLPAVTLALPHAAVIARLARAGMVEVMRQDFVRTARAKGLPERTVVWRHALRPALLPVVSYLGPAAAGILTGSFVVETLFGLPGMGQWFVKGAINRDYPVVLGTALFYFALVSFFNLAVDLAYAWLDPRSEVDA